MPRIKKGDFKLFKSKMAAKRSAAYARAHGAKARIVPVDYIYGRTRGWRWRVNILGKRKRRRR